MTKQKSRGWAQHLEATKDYPPSPWLLRAMPFVKEKQHALDMGGGALKDTRYLLAQGFDVTVVDSEPLVKEMAASITSSKLHVVISSFEDYAFPENAFDLVSAMYSLPFTQPKSFEKVFTRAIESLKTGGVFCGQLFGVKDSWHANPAMTFHEKAEVEKLFTGLTILTLEEQEKDSKTTNGVLKHWHLFHFIAKK